MKEAVTHQAGHRGANQATDAIESDTPWGQKEKAVFKLGNCLAGTVNGVGTKVNFGHKWWSMALGAPDPC